MSMVAEEFSLNTEGFSNALQHSVCFNHWCSESPSDALFGTMGSFFAADLVGKNIFAFPPPDSHEVIIRCLERCSSLIDSKVATRVVLLLPEQVEHKFLVIARLLQSPIFTSKPQSDYKFSLVLALNKESMQLDPINWSLTVAKLRKWSPLVDVPVLTDSLFRERALPTHQPRSSSK